MNTITKHNVAEVSRMLHEAIAETLHDEPHTTYSQAAAIYGVSLRTVCNIAKANNVQRPRGVKKLGAN